jgi:hypothetical protein
MERPASGIPARPAHPPPRQVDAGRRLRAARERRRDRRKIGLIGASAATLTSRGERIVFGTFVREIEDECAARMHEVDVDPEAANVGPSARSRARPVASMKDMPWTTSC